MTSRLPFLLIPLALLAACKDEARSDGRTASGEVLEGTASDAMLPLDTVRSQSPLMKSQSGKAGTAAQGPAEPEEGPSAGEAPPEAAAAQTP